MSEEAKVAIARARSAAKIAQAEAAAKIAEAEAKGANASSVSSTPDSQIGSYNFFTKNNIPLFYYGPYGSTATVVGQNNQYMIVITTKGGETIKYRPRTSDSSSQSFFDNLVKDSQTESTDSTSTVPQILLRNLKMLSSMMKMVIMLVYLFLRMDNMSFLSHKQMVSILFIPAPMCIHMTLTKQDLLLLENPQLVKQVLVK